MRCFVYPRDGGEIEKWWRVFFKLFFFPQFFVCFPFYSEWRKAIGARKRKGKRSKGGRSVPFFCLSFFFFFFQVSPVPRMTRLIARGGGEKGDFDVAKGAAGRL